MVFLAGANYTCCKIKVFIIAIYANWHNLY